MGCDIHMVLEKKTDSGWLGLHAFPYTCQRKGHGDWIARERDYDLFADLASVRGVGSTGNKPRGLPDDISELGRYMASDSDGHSRTHMLLSEAWPIFSIHKFPGALLEDDRLLGCDKLFDVDSEDAHNYRLIIWFDN